LRIADFLYRHSANRTVYVRVRINCWAVHMNQVAAGETRITLCWVFEHLHADGAPILGHILNTLVVIFLCIWAAIPTQFAMEKLLPLSPSTHPALVLL
jgi:hypothetical protein